MYDTTDALPCLNCEADPVLAHVIPDGWHVICPACGNKTEFFASEDDAVDAWNGGPSYRETLERLRASI